MERVYDKLVRDKIPEIIESKGETPVTRELGDYDYKVELEKKLQEENNEVLSATTSKDRLEELADMLEVIFALGSIENATEQNLMDIMYQKREQRGGFVKKLYLERVIEK